MDKYVVLQAILRIKDYLYEDGYICIDKSSGEIIKSSFGLDIVCIEMKNNRLYLTISEYEPNYESYYCEICFVSNYSSIDYIECPYSYSLKSKQTDMPAELAITNVVKDSKLLSCVLKGITT